MSVLIRRMRAGDLDAVLALQAAAYADAIFAPEGGAVYLNRMQLAPDLCLVAETAGGALAGYLLSHPWHAGKPPALDTVLDALPVPATHWYLHDCAVDRTARSTGLAARLYERAHDTAVGRGLRSAALVAVGDAATYWQRRGYRPEPAALPAQALDSYGAAACYMTRELEA